MRKENDSFNSEAKWNSLIQNFSGDSVQFSKLLLYIYFVQNNMEIIKGSGVTQARSNTK